MSLLRRWISRKQPLVGIGAWFLVRSCSNLAILLSYLTHWSFCLPYKVISSKICCPEDSVVSLTGVPWKLATGDDDFIGLFSAIVLTGELGGFYGCFFCSSNWSWWWSFSMTKELWLTKSSLVWTWTSISIFSSPLSSDFPIHSCAPKSTVDLGYRRTVSYWGFGDLKLTDVFSVTSPYIIGGGLAWSPLLMFLFSTLYICDWTLLISNSGKYKVVAFRGL